LRYAPTIVVPARAAFIDLRRTLSRLQKTTGTTHKLFLVRSPISAAFATSRPARFPSTANRLLSELHDLSGLSLREIEERTGVGASRLCLAKRGTVTLRPEQFEVVERVLRDEIIQRDRREKDRMQAVST
jgi:hypothetical protein